MAAAVAGVLLSAGPAVARVLVGSLVSAFIAALPLIEIALLLVIGHASLLSAHQRAGG